MAIDIKRRKITRVLHATLFGIVVDDTDQGSIYKVGSSRRWVWIHPKYGTTKFPLHYNASTVLLHILIVTRGTTAHVVLPTGKVIVKHPSDMQL